MPYYETYATRSEAVHREVWMVMTMPSWPAGRLRLRRRNSSRHDDRHIRSKIEGVNRSQGEAGETIHHLFIAKLKGYMDQSVYSSYRTRYKERIRMLNGLEKSLEKHLPESERRWPLRVRGQA